MGLFSSTPHLCENSELAEEIPKKIRKDNYQTDKTGKKAELKLLITLTKPGDLKGSLILKEGQQKHYFMLFAQPL